nr:MAG TPA: hypothetical protein [Caudoviricetes sp.]DAI53784.1 MAG TPA: hypothetical protein [Caudoviricetes sp.]
MDKNEKLKLGDIFLAPKEFFLDNSVGKLKLQIESHAEVRKDGRVMCAVVENIDSVFPHQSEYTIAVKQKEFAPPIRICVSKDYNFDCIELLSKEEMKVAGVLWFLFGI